MSRDAVGFLPDRLRPGRRIRSARRMWVLPLLLPCLLVLPWWRLQAVVVDDGGVVPAQTRQALEGLVGSPVLTLDLDWVRHHVEGLPAAHSVDVHLRLPGTLSVTARPAQVFASLPIGRSWHGVAGDGNLTGALPGPRAPRLLGFRMKPEELRRGLEVARRLQRTTGHRVDAVTEIMPGNFLVDIDVAGQSTVLHTQSQATAAETYWSQRASGGGPVPVWADVRAPNRMVIALGSTPPAVEQPIHPLGEADG